MVMVHMQTRGNMQQGVVDDFQILGHERGSITINSSQLFQMWAHLSSSVDFVGEFDLVEGDRRLHPMSSKIWGVGVDVDSTVTLSLSVPLRTSGHHPLPIYELPAAAVGWHEVEQEGVHGAGVQPGHADPQDREHSTAQTQL